MMAPADAPQPASPETLEGHPLLTRDVEPTTPQGAEETHMPPPVRTGEPLMRVRNVVREYPAGDDVVAVLDRLVAAAWAVDVVVILVNLAGHGGLLLSFSFLQRCRSAPGERGRAPAGAPCHC